MEIRVRPSNLSGAIKIPASKSHTIRAIILAGLSHGESIIQNPLLSRDTQAALFAMERFGAVYRFKKEPYPHWIVQGTNNQIKVPDNIIDVMNSGTTLYIMCTIAALADGYTVFTGDESIRSRPCEGLLQSLRDLGATAFSTRNNGKAPLIIAGPLKGGSTTIEAYTSQYITSLLLGAPLIQEDTKITATLLNEQPYVQMTLDWLDYLNITYDHKNYKEYWIKGGQSYSSFSREVPGDFSSATFFLCAGALNDQEVEVEGLDFKDSQGDKVVIEYLEKMGARIKITQNSVATSRGELIGKTLDINATPDALPALTVVAALSKGETRLINVPQARKKETDRIEVMAKELTKMGADIKELPDGLVIQGGKLKGARVYGHHDHRVVMALAVAGLFASGETIIETAESVDVTFPNFVELMQSLGAEMDFFG